MCKLFRQHAVNSLQFCDKGRLRSIPSSPAKWGMARCVGRSVGLAGRGMSAERGDVLKSLARCCGCSADCRESARLNLEL